MCWQTSKGQSIKLHGDIGIQYSHFRAKALQGISNGRPGGSLRLGAAYNFRKKNQYFIGTELGVYMRRMKRSVDEYYFINRFLTFELPVFVRIRISDNWFAEAGVALLNVWTDQSALQNAESSTRIRLGSGFQRVDIAPYLGGLYKFSQYFAVGGRARFGLKPMVEFQKIGDYGEFGPVQSDLYSTNFEVFIRISNF